MGERINRPAIRIVLAPLARYNSKINRDRGISLYGMQQGRTVYIDPRTVNPVSTYIHEKCHMDHPDWAEEQVEAFEHQWWTTASWREKAEILILLGRAEIKDSKEVIG